MRLLICAGGTGGGVYPALSVLQAVGDRADSILWVGGKNGMEADLVARNGIPYVEIPAAGLHGVGVLALPGNLLKLIQGMFRSWKILRESKPDVLLFTGGYVAVPMAIAGAATRSLLYVPDIEPGMALKAIARNADVIALTAEDSKSFFNPAKKMVVTGYPTRSTLKKLDKAEARKIFNLTDDLPVVLVIGGSKGARSINNAILDQLPGYLSHFQILHITGQLDWDEINKKTKSLPISLAGRYHSYPFLHEEIGAAFSAADLSISRSGASVLGELPLFGLPAILIPYPFAWRYQKVNADYLVRHGAAIMVKNEELSEKLLSTTLKLVNDSDKLSEMSKQMELLHQPQAAQKIAELLIELTEKRVRGRIR